MTEPFRPVGTGAGERPRHPTRTAAVLMVGVLVAVMALAALSTWGAL